MRAVRHYGTFVNGKLRANTFTAALRALSERGVPVVLTVEEDKGKRSLPQNNYYWFCMDLVGRGLADLGWEPKQCTKEAAHAMMAREFLTVDAPGADGVLIHRVRSTTELNKEEFSTYMEHVIRFAAEYLNVTIPNAGEQMEIAA